MSKFNFNNRSPLTVKKLGRIYTLKGSKTEMTVPTLGLPVEMVLNDVIGESTKENEKNWVMLGKSGEDLLERVRV